MSLITRTPDENDFEEMLALDQRAFSFSPKPEEVAATKRLVDLSRFRIVISDGQIVAIAGSYAMDLTLPGSTNEDPASVPMAGVTWVSVSPTQRRRGLLRSLMTEIHGDSAERGEAILGLTASEGGIYERFGYGVATRSRVVSIDPRQAVFRDGVAPGAIRLIDPLEHLDRLVKLWARYAQKRSGEVSRSAAYFERDLTGLNDKGLLVGAIHNDGFALWSVNPNWDNGHPKHTLSLVDLAACTPEAHSDLWKTVLSVDLVAEVKTYRALSPGDPLPYLLTNPRVVRVIDNNDGLWLKPVDIVASFSARSYRCDDELVIKIGSEDSSDGTYRVTANSTERCDAKPDLEMTQAAAGCLLLGGVSVTELALGGRVSAASPGALIRGDLFFGWEPKPHMQTPF